MHVSKVHELYQMHRQHTAGTASMLGTLCMRSTVLCWPHRALPSRGRDAVGDNALAPWLPLRMYLPILDSLLRVASCSASALLSRASCSLAALREMRYMVPSWALPVPPTITCSS